MFLKQLICIKKQYKNSNLNDCGEKWLLKLTNECEKQTSIP